MTMSDGNTKTIDVSFFENHFRKPTKLCATLQILDIGDTRVTRIGVLVALINLPQLRSLGEHCHIGNGLELLDRCTITTPELRLSLVNSCHTNFAKFQSICNMCTHLNRLILTDPWLYPPMLCGLPRTLTCLRLRHVNTDPAWVDGLYKFVTGPHSRILRELSVTFQAYDRRRTVDLDVFLLRLDNLEMLEVDGIQTKLHRGNRATVTALGKLKKICLGNVDGPHTLGRLLKITPGLEVLHVFRCPGPSNSIFMGLFDGGDTTGRFSTNLKCVYVNDLPDGNETTAKWLVRSCPKLKHIGNVYSWDHNRFEVTPLIAWMLNNNLKLELYGENHWKNRECVYLN